MLLKRYFGLSSSVSMLHSHKHHILDANCAFYSLDQAGSSDAKASGYQLDDCQVTSLQLTSGCVVSHVALSVFFKLLS